MLLDLHTHSIVSPDGWNKQKDFINLYRKKGIIPAITDHNTIRFWKGLDRKKFPFIPGEEIRTDRGDLIALFLNEEIPKFTPFFDTLDRIREQGAISYVPHFFDSTRHGVNDKNLAKEVDIIEVFNPRNLQKIDEKAMLLAEEFKKIKGAGSDAHFPFELGNAYVETKEFDLDSPKDFLKAMKEGKIHGLRRVVYLRGITSVMKVLKPFIKFALR